MKLPKVPLPIQAAAFAVLAPRAVPILHRTVDRVRDAGKRVIDRVAR